jgi:hypothetical protein
VRVQLADMLALQAEVVRLQQQLVAMHDSRSWRITRPLRWMSLQRIALREQGWRERLRRIAIRLGLASSPAPNGAQTSTAASAGAAPNEPARPAAQSTADVPPPAADAAPNARPNP